MAHTHAWSHHEPWNERANSRKWAHYQVCAVPCVGLGHAACMLMRKPTEIAGCDLRSGWPPGSAPTTPITSACKFVWVSPLDKPFTARSANLGCFCRRSSAGRSDGSWPPKAAFLCVERMKCKFESASSCNEELVYFERHLLNAYLLWETVKYCVAPQASRCCGC